MAKTSSWAHEAREVRDIETSLPTSKSWICKVIVVIFDKTILKTEQIKQQNLELHQQESMY